MICYSRISQYALLAVMIVEFTLLGARSAYADDPYLLVNSTGNDTVVKFDIVTGAANLFAQYNSGDDPRNLAMDGQGDVFASLGAGHETVVELVPQSGSSVLVSKDFTAAIPGDGPGQIQFYNGDLYAAGDESRVIYQFDGTTGAQIRTFSASTSFNIRAMTISGNTLYYSEIFQDRVRKFDLTQNPPTGGTFFTDSTHLNDSWNMTVGFNNVLVLANRGDTKLQEYDVTTGTYLGMLADLDNFDSALTQSWDVTYNAALNNYFVSSGNKIFRLDDQGNLLQTYSSALLQGASGVLAVPEPTGAALLMLGACGLLMFRQKPRDQH
jgi:hypothetical protein